jgi:hypothetical protein
MKKPNIIVIGDTAAHLGAKTAFAALQNELDKTIILKTPEDVLNIIEDGTDLREKAILIALQNELVKTPEKEQHVNPFDNTPVMHIKAPPILEYPIAKSGKEKRRERRAAERRAKKLKRKL